MRAVGKSLTIKCRYILHSTVIVKSCQGIVTSLTDSPGNNNSIEAVCLTLPLP